MIEIAKAQGKTSGTICQVVLSGSDILSKRDATAEKDIPLGSLLADTNKSCRWLIAIHEYDRE